MRNIQRSQPIGFEELQRRIGDDLAFRGYYGVCSRATLKRDFDVFRKEFGIEIEYNRSGAGYGIKVMNRHWLDADSIVEPLEILTAFDRYDGVPEWIFLEKHHASGSQHFVGHHCCHKGVALHRVPLQEVFDC